MVITDDKEIFVGRSNDTIDWLSNALHNFPEMWESILQVKTGNYSKESDSAVGFFNLTPHCKA